MAGSVNKVIRVGNLGKDPEVRNTQGGSKIISFSLATSDSWADKASGERRERTKWHRIVIFNERIGDVAERHLCKLRKVFVEGVLRAHRWINQDGQDRYIIEAMSTIARKPSQIRKLSVRCSPLPGPGYGIIGRSSS